MQAEGSEIVTSVFFVTFCGRDFFLKLNMCIYNVYIYTEIYILGNSSMQPLSLGPTCPSALNLGPLIFLLLEGCRFTTCAGGTKPPVALYFCLSWQRKALGAATGIGKGPGKSPLDKLGPVGWAS